MYCDDSRVTQVEAKEVVVSLPREPPPLHKLTPFALVGKTRLHLILQESQNINYTFIYLPIFPSCLLASPLLHTPSPLSCCISFEPYNYTGYA